MVGNAGAHHSAANDKDIGCFGHGHGLLKMRNMSYLASTKIPVSWRPQGPIHFQEDVLRVKRSRFRSVIPSLRSRASSERSEGSLSGERSFAALRMTKRDGLLLEMDWPQGLPGSHLSCA